MGSRFVSISGHLLVHSMKLARITMCVPVQDLTLPTVELYLPSSVKTTSVKLEADN